VVDRIDMTPKIGNTINGRSDEIPQGTGLAIHQATAHKKVPRAI
jgi:hypothetical protein